MIRWRDWHQNKIDRIGTKQTVGATLSEVVVQEKGPRLHRGNSIEGQENNRVSLKTRAKVHTADMWRSTLYLIQTIAQDSGGYDAGVQAPPPGIRTLQSRMRSKGGGKGGGEEGGGDGSRGMAGVAAAGGEAAE